MTLYGWTFTQWAGACAILNRQPKTLPEAVKLNKDWKASNRCDPSDEQIIWTNGEDKRPLDYESANRIFMLPIG